MIGKLVAKNSGRVRQFKPEIHQNRGRGQNRGYNQRNYQNRYRSDNRPNSRDRGQFRQDRVDTDLSKVIGEIILGKIKEIMADENSRGRYRNNSYMNNIYDRSRNRSRERSLS